MYVCMIMHMYLLHNVEQQWFIMYLKKKLNPRSKGTFKTRNEMTQSTHYIYRTSLLHHMCVSIIVMSMHSLGE